MAPGASWRLPEPPKGSGKPKKGSGPGQIQPKTTDLVTKVHFHRRNELRICIHGATDVLEPLGPSWALRGHQGAHRPPGPLRGVWTSWARVIPGVATLPIHVVAMLPSVGCRCDDLRCDDAGLTLLHWSPRSGGEAFLGT